MSDTKKHPVDPSNVKVGDIMAFTYWVKVVEKNKQGDVLTVGDLDREGSYIKIEGKELIQRSFSADQSHEDVKTSKTHAAEMVVGSANKPITVCFIKSNGDERTMKCRLIKPEPLLGRSMVEDLEAPASDRLKQVDHRTIKWLIVDGVKYIVKG